jgi:acetyl esterase/lipase
MRSLPRWFLGGLTASGLCVALAACATSGTPASAFASPIRTAASSASALASAAANENLEIRVISDVAFESASPNELGLLDVYAPTIGRDWPVVVMFHGNPLAVDKAYLAEYALQVAELGFVVFVPSWGHSGGAAYDSLTMKEQLMADGAQAACGLAFAAAHAGEYGGDASSITAFGHSAGGNIEAIAVLAHPELKPGCLARDRPQVDGFVAWEGDWLLLDEMWDGPLRDDPAVRDVIAPWAHLPAPAGLAFVFLRGDSTGVGRDAADARGAGGWLSSRDPDGTFRTALEAAGAFDDGVISADDTDQLLADRLRAQGIDVQQHVMPQSTHTSLSSAGWRIFLDPFRALRDR